MLPFALAQPPWLQIYCLQRFKGFNLPFNSSGTYQNMQVLMLFRTKTNTYYFNVWLYIIRLTSNHNKDYTNHLFLGDETGFTWLKLNFVNGMCTPLVATMTLYIYNLSQIHHKICKFLIEDFFPLPSNYFGTSSNNSPNI